VSGGGDSLALAVLLAEWAGPPGVGLHAATVDHGLRAGSATEAQSVSRMLAPLGIAHDILSWDGAARGNLQDSARRARYRLLSGWAREKQLAHVCVGHTRDDQAETVLLRLARGSGVDGLAAMSPARRDAGGPTWLRPLLSVRREELRQVLREAGIGWIEDPSNENQRFDRVRVREFLGANRLGIGVERLADTARAMGAARRVLAGAARAAAMRLVTVESGDVLIEAEGFTLLEEETRWRILSHAIRQIGNADYRPRLKSLLRAEAALAAGVGTTLGGCLLLPGARWRIGREYRAVDGVEVPAPGIWDGRWRIEGGGEALTIRALGPAGLALVPDWREAGLPRSSALALPAVWSGGALVAAPQLGYGKEWEASPLLDKIGFCDGLQSH
jgi:tRNA(Ile)-lysidine synthase